MGRLILCATLFALVVVSFAHTHSHEAPHLKYSREVNEAAAKGEDTVGDHGHSHGGHDDHDHHGHVHEHHGHLHHDDHDHDHEHDHHHDHEHDHHHDHDHHDHHGHDHEHHHHPVVSDFKFSETGPLAFLNDPKQRFWTFSIGSTILISLFPCFILTFIPINSNEDENSSNKLKVLLALGAGGLLGDAFLHLIPHAQMAHGDGHGHTHSHSHSHAAGEAHEPHDLSVGGWVLGGFFIFFLVEKFVRIVRGDDGHGHSHGPAKPKDKKKPVKKAKSSDTDHTDDEEDHHEQHRAAIEAARLQVAAYLNLIADFMHNFTDGLAIGASFVAGEKVGIITMITVLIHEIPHEIGDFAILVQSGYSKRKAMLIQLLTALGALAGCIIACLSSDPFSLAEQAQSSWVLPFTAGGFIYIAAVSVIPELLEKSSLLLSIAEVFAMTLGVFAMYLIALYE